MYINNLVDAMYIKRILTLLTDFDLPHLCCIHKKIAYVTKLYIYQVSFCVNRGRMFVRLKQKLFYLDCKSPKTYPKFGHVKALCHAIQGYKGHCPPPRMLVIGQRKTYGRGSSKSWTSFYLKRPLITYTVQQAL